MNSKDHWEKVYGTKSPDAVSWFSPHLETSINLIHEATQDKTASIIDIGGGEATLVDDLLAEGFIDLSVLDISQRAIDFARGRISKGGAIKCIGIVLILLKLPYLKIILMFGTIGLSSTF